MAARFETILADALQLPDAERGELAARLLRSLEDADSDDDLSAEAWEAEWSAELDQRVREIREGTVEGIDGPDARAQIRAAIATLRP
jgi:hypothetical protein